MSVPTKCVSQLLSSLLIKDSSTFAKVISKIKFIFIIK